MNLRNRLRGTPLPRCSGTTREDQTPNSVPQHHSGLELSSSPDSQKHFQVSLSIVFRSAAGAMAVPRAVIDEALSSPFRYLPLIPGQMLQISRIHAVRVPSLRKVGPLDLIAMLKIHGRQNPYPQISP